MAVEESDKSVREWSCHSYFAYYIGLGRWLYAVPDDVGYAGRLVPTTPLVVRLAAAVAALFALRRCKV